MPNVSLASGNAGTQDAGAAMAVEARFRGAVIDARQIRPGGRPGLPAPAWFAAGGALVLASLALFFASVGDSARAAAGGAGVQAAAPTPGRDALAVVAAAAGLVLVGLGFHRRGERRARYVLGATAGAHAPVAPEYTDGRPFALVEAGAAGCVVNVTPWMQGEVLLNDRVVVPLRLWTQQRGSSFVLPAGSHARVSCGELELHLHPTVPAPALRPPLLALHWREQKYTAATALGLLVAVGVLAAVPPDARALSLDELGGRARFMISTLVPPEPRPAPPAHGGGSAGEAHKGAEGALGKPQPRTQGRLAVAGRARQVQLAAARPMAPADISAAGALGVFKQAEGGILAGVLAARSVGPDDTSVLGGLVAAPIGEGWGAGGLGVRGTGWGGGGEGTHTIGTGGFNTIGWGRGGCAGNPDCAGYDDRGTGDLGPRRPARVPPAYVHGEGTSRGALDKEIIRRVIRAHINEVRYCYEKELARNPELNGRVTMNFTIAATGKVAASLIQNSTMGNVMVESCLVTAVRRWQFPSPTDGGIVIATYPFSFAPAGGR